MDTRLVELLPAALGIRNGDAKLIKNAGAVLSHPYGSVMRSLLVCIYQLNVTEIFVVGHHDCGLQNLDVPAMTAKFAERGIEPAALEQVRREVDLDHWLSGFEDTADSVRQTVRMIRQHKRVPKALQVHGLIMDPAIGRLDPVES